MPTITIAAEHNGPRHSANGGVTAGRVAALLPWSEAVFVRLHRPPPLGVPLDATVDGRGVVTVTGPDGAVVVTGATASAPDVIVPRVDDEPRSGVPTRIAPTCVVCGPDRRDGLRLFPTPIDCGAGPQRGDERVVAARWTPPAWALVDGELAPHLLWGVLDCPGSLAVSEAATEAVVAALGEMTGVVHRPIVAGEEVLVLGWTAGATGRRRYAGTAVLDAHGDLVAASAQTCVAMPPAWARSARPDLVRQSPR